MENLNTKQHGWKSKIVLDIMYNGGLNFGSLFDILPAAIKYCGETGHAVSFDNDLFGMITVFKPREKANAICINPEGLKTLSEKTFIIEDYTAITPETNLVVRKSDKLPIGLYYYEIGKCFGDIIELWYSFKKKGNTQNVEEEKEHDDKLGG